MNFSGFVFLRFISAMDFWCLFIQFVWPLLPLWSPINPHSNNISCKLFIVGYLCFMGSGSYLICAMGLERFYALFRPISYREKVTISFNTGISIGCVLLGFLIGGSGAPFYGNDVGYCFGVQKNVNMDLFKIRDTVSVIFTYILPAVIIPVTNATLIIKLRARDATRLLSNFLTTLNSWKLVKILYTVLKRMLFQRRYPATIFQKEPSEPTSKLFERTES